MAKIKVFKDASLKNIEEAVQEWLDKNKGCVVTSISSMGQGSLSFSVIVAIDDPKS